MFPFFNISYGIIPNTPISLRTDTLSHTQRVCTPSPVDCLVFFSISWSTGLSGLKPHGSRCSLHINITRPYDIVNSETNEEEANVNVSPEDCTSYINKK